MDEPNISRRDDPITIYHGTTLDHARRIAVEGLRGEDRSSVAALLGELDTAHGVPQGTALEAYQQFGFLPADDTVVYVSTGWKHAAAYAGNGPEYVYLGLCGIGRALAAEEVAWAEAHRSHTLAVVTLVAPRREVAARYVGSEPLTDDVLDPCRDPRGAAVGCADELVLTGPLPASWVVKIEVLDGRCLCADVKNADHCSRCPRAIDL